MDGLKLQTNLILTKLSFQIIRMALNFIAKAPGNFLRFSQPRLKTFAKYAKVELTPPSPGELGQVKNENLKYKLKAEVKSYNRKIRHNP